MNVFGGGRRSGIERDIIAENKQPYIVFIIKKKIKKESGLFGKNQSTLCGLFEYEKVHGSNQNGDGD